MLGTWWLVEMLGINQVHRWIGIAQTYQTLDLDTRGYVFGYIWFGCSCLDADTEAQQNQRPQSFCLAKHSANLCVTGHGSHERGFCAMPLCD